MNYRHLFFDLDHTLWDLERNSAEALGEVYRKHSLDSLGISSVIDFQREYSKINLFMWEQFRLGRIDRDALRIGRFAYTLQHFGLPENPMLVKKLAEDYLELTPGKGYLIPEAIETLTYLQGSYAMHIITNGFPEVQHRKLSASGISHYFSSVIISEEVGFKKPEKEIFEYAVNAAGARREESMMIGDSFEIDVIGAKEFGMTEVWFNPSRLKPRVSISHDIASLAELRSFL